jgi:hypothetical protein
MRCDYALLANLALSAVSITSGSPVNSSAAASAITAGVALANAGTSSCSAARRALAGAGARALQTAAATLPFATFSLLIGASTSEAGAAAIAAAVQSPTATFPNTLQAWAPTWGLTSATWTAAGYNSPVATSDDEVINNAASFSPMPGPVLTSQQQLGLGLGIGIPLALIVFAVAVCACYMNSRAVARTSNRLSVVALPTKRDAQI